MIRMGNEPLVISNRTKLEITILPIHNYFISTNSMKCATNPMKSISRSMEANSMQLTIE
jgi:hypothetical protein